MHHSLPRRLLSWSLGATLLLPVMLTLSFGLGALLRKLGDAEAATACGWIALVLGIAWLTALVVTTVAGGIVTLLHEPVGRPLRRRRRRRPEADRPGAAT